LSIDDSYPETLAMTCLITGFMADDYESAIEMADRVRSTSIHIGPGSTEAGSIKLRDCRKKQSGALNTPFA
jgi:hypothetical protein